MSGLHCPEPRRSANSIPLLSEPLPHDSRRTKGLRDIPDFFSMAGSLLAIPVRSSRERPGGAMTCDHQGCRCEETGIERGGKRFCSERCAEAETETAGKREPGC